MKNPFVAGIVGLLLSSVAVSSPVALPDDGKHTSFELDKRRCGFSTWDSTNVTNWFEADTDGWFNKWWHKYLGGNGGGLSQVIVNGWPNDFVNLFGRMYLNGSENYHCQKPNDVCFGDVFCGDIACSGNWGEECKDHDKQRPVYLVMQSVQGFQDYFRDLIQALDESQMNLNGMTAYLSENFFPPINKRFEEFIRELTIALGTVVSIGAGFSKLTTWVKATDLRKESAGAFGNLVNGIGAEYREVVKLPADQKFSDFAELGAVMTNIFEQTRTMLNNMQENIAIGNYWHGKRFLDYAKGGAFLRGPGPEFSSTPRESQLSTLRRYLQKQFNARAINYIWRQQKIFITYTTDVDGSCEQDRQGPQDMKYCRDGDPGVYYLYFWHERSVGAGLTVGLNTFATGKMDHPVGWDKLAAGWVEPGYRLALRDVFEASVAAYRAHGFAYDGENAIKRASAAAAAQGSAPRPWERGTAWEGTFTIPVCDTGAVSYNVPLGQRIMPCGCGRGGAGAEVAAWRRAANFEGYRTYDEQCTAGKQAARRQARRGGRGNAEAATPALPGAVNEIQCLTGDGPAARAMTSHISACSAAVASLGADRGRQVCTRDCADGAAGQNSRWCRVALDKSNIHQCALTVAAKDRAHGGPDFACLTVGDAQDFYANAAATVEKGGKGCHVVGTPDFAATFVTPDGMARWCLSDYRHANYCTI
ncbi:hypothetical protein GGS23DRAFT_619597 [Durotheca rogersii]|uniref:uncharacterized protein n=1 Tax=Durotheca rogersii TaxID=419775 RepID=UPI0022202FD5|nr:uncharacterized protein GGS23DRAFT_619597 [Durotheca rogersii]KAI5864890.1 hypothetical protein GGS23DRAFT_619597 [Durotheca rogersii]